MQRLSNVLMSLCLISFISPAWGEETANKPSTPPTEGAPKREVQSLYDGQDSYEPIEDEPKSERRRFKTKSGIGTQISFYYDGLTSFDRIYTTGVSPDQFTEQSFNGISGIQILAGYAHKRWEFMTGVDYAFPVNIQGQGISGNLSIQNQDLNIMGIKAAQVGYRIAEGNLLIIPYGGFGIYYGKNVLKYSGATGENTVTYAKIMANFVGGVRLDYNFTQDGSFIGGLGAEVFMPVKLADHLAQAGTPNLGLGSSELSGYGPQLQSHMDFMNSVGGRLMASVAAFF